jgi:hypothetical protein
MRVLFVTPVEEGSGEIITSRHVADDLVARGDDVLFLGSDLAARFLSDRYAGRFRRLGPDGVENRRTWHAAIDTFKPDAIVFADYPLLFFPHGTAPLADPEWEAGLTSLDACLVTFDHFGFAQEPMGMFFGPPHLSLHYQTFPAVPDRMHLMLPCPMHEPGPVAGRRGATFRYSSRAGDRSSESRSVVRRRYLDHVDDFLIFHAVPTWAWRQAELLGLPLYRYLGSILDVYLRNLPRPVTLVSVNNGLLLKTPLGAGIRIVNLEPLPTADFEELMFASDAALTENSVSIAMGKAVCGLHPCGALSNSYGLPAVLDRIDGPIKELVLEMEQERLGSIFPFRVFPTGMIQELERIVLYRDNSLTAAFRSFEIFGGDETRDRLRAFLLDPDERAALRRAQAEYVSRLERIGTAGEVLENLVTQEAGRAVSPGPVPS